MAPYGINFGFSPEELTDEWPATPDELEFLPLSLFLLEKMHPSEPTTRAHGKMQIQKLKVLWDGNRDPMREMCEEMTEEIHNLVTGFLVGLDTEFSIRHDMGPVVGLKVVDKAPHRARLSYGGWGSRPHIGAIGRSAGVVTALHLKKGYHKGMSIDHNVKEAALQGAARVSQLITNSPTPPLNISAPPPKAGGSGSHEPWAPGEAEDMTRVYMWTIMRKLCHATYKAPLPTKEEHQKVKEMAGAPEVTEASNEVIEMRTGREVVDLRPDMESMFARLDINSRGSRGNVQGQDGGSGRSADQQQQQRKKEKEQEQKKQKEQQEQRKQKEMQRQQHEQYSSECKQTAETARATSSRARACAECGKTDGGLQRCGGCRVVRYCSAACQRKAWPAHKKECKQV